MNSKTKTVHKEKKILWFVLVNTLLMSFTLYVHYLLKNTGVVHGDTIMENAAIWLLVVFKFAGTNLILAEIFNEYKIVNK